MDAAGGEPLPPGEAQALNEWPCCCSVHTDIESAGAVWSGIDGHAMAGGPP